MNVVEAKLSGPDGSATQRAYHTLRAMIVTGDLRPGEKLKIDALRQRLSTGASPIREALSLLKAGAIDGLSIGYRTVKSEKSGAGRLLLEIDLWEVSLVTFPMLPDARIGPRPGEVPDTLALSLADMFTDARKQMA